MTALRHFDRVEAPASVFVLPDAESLALAAATAVVAEARRAVMRTGRFAVALSGGATPRRTYELLATAPYPEMMPWDATDVFWSDERCVPRDDPRSNEGMAREVLLDRVPIPPEQVHPMYDPVRLDAAPSGAGPSSSRDSDGHARALAEAYERELRSHLAGRPDGAQAGVGSAVSATGIDLVLLGLGADGHTASLFPASGALDENGRWVVATPDGPAAPAGPILADAATPSCGTAGPLWRITLTAGFINQAAMVLFVVSGVAKAAAVKEALEGEADPQEFPARLIHPQGGRLCWLLDEEAASHLSSTAEGVG